MVGIKEGIAHVAALEVIDDQGQPRQHAQRKHQAGGMRQVEPPDQVTAGLGLWVEYQFLVHRVS